MNKMNRMNRINLKSSLWTTILVLILIAYVTFPMISLFGKVTAQSLPRIYVDPPSTIVDKPPASFTISIMVADVPPTPPPPLNVGVNGWEFKIKFDSSILYTKYDPDPSKSYITEGDFLTNNNNGDTTKFQAVFKAAESAWLVNCIVNGPGTSSGSGTLAYIQFDILDAGKSVLDLFDSKLYDIDVKNIPHDDVDGLFYTRYPKASFYYLPSTTAVPDYLVDPSLKRNPIVGETITFNASAFVLGGFYKGSYDSDGTIVSYSWDFGDGNVTAVISPIITHRYSENKTYTVTLTVTDDATPPQSDTDTLGVTVDLHDIAITQVKVTPTTIRPGQTAEINVTVVNQGSIGEYFNVTAYYNNTAIWYNQTENKQAFSKAIEIDPITGSIKGLDPGKSITITFKWNTTGVAEGTYTIRANAILVDIHAEFLPLEAYTTDNEKTVPNILLTFGAPIADFTFTPSHPRVGEVVTFNATASNDTPPGWIVTYTWDFGDGNVTSVPDLIVTHVYSNVKTYTVTLNVTDNDGLNGTKIEFLTVDIHDIAITSVTISPTTVNVGASVIVTVIVENKGGFTETFDVTAYYDGNSISTKTSTLLAGGSKNLQFTWQTTEVSLGTYTIKAVASEVAYEANTTNNLKTAADQVTLTAHNIAVENIDASPTTVKVGESISINVTVRNKGSFDETKLYVITYYNENVIENRTNISLNKGASTTLPFTWNTAGVAAGTFTIKAVAGIPVETDTTDNTRTYGTVTLEKAESTISIQASPNTSTVGESVTISGTITPKRSGATVTILFRLNGTEAWFNLGSVTTGQNSEYSYTWKPTRPGTYEIKATWAGDASTLGDESDMETVTIREAPTLNLYLYAAAGVAILIIVAAIVYFIKFRKTS